MLPLPPSCLWVLPESGAWGSRPAGEGAHSLWRAGGDSLGTQVPSLWTGSACLGGHGEAGNQAKPYFLDFIKILLADVCEAVQKLVPVLYLFLLQCSVVVNRCQGEQVPVGEDTVWRWPEIQGRKSPPASRRNPLSPVMLGCLLPGLCLSCLLVVRGDVHPGRLQQAPELPGF